MAIAWRIKSAGRSALRLLARNVARFGRVAWRLAGPATVVLALGILAVQPDAKHSDPAMIVAIGSLLGLSLSVAAAVALLLVQQMAERYPRQLFREFRRDPNWILVIGVAAAAVCWTAGSALWQPTASTAWAAWLSVVGVLLLVAERLPYLFDSLDAEVLSTRFASAALARLRSRKTRGAFAEELQTSAQSLATIARQGVQQEDEKVVFAALVGINDLLVTYVGSAGYVGIEDPSVDYVMQRYTIVTEAAIGSSRVVALPAVVESLKDLGAKAARVRLPLNPDWEAVTGRVTNLLGQIAEASLRDQLSWSGSMATAAVADGALELVRNARVAAIRQHLDLLTQVGRAGYSAKAFHMSAQSSHGLARLAQALLTVDSGDIMASSHFERAAHGLHTIASAFLASDTGAWGPGDTGVLPVVGPLATPNLASLAVDALARMSGRSGRRELGLDAGVSQIFRTSLDLAFPKDHRTLVAGDARRACAMAIAGGLRLMPDRRVTPVVAGWWNAFVPRLLNQIEEPEGGDLDDEALLLSLLLWALYRSSEVPASDAQSFTELLRSAMTAASGMTGRRSEAALGRIWRSLGAAAVGVGNSSVASEAARIAGLPERADPMDPDPGDGFYRDIFFGSGFTPGPLLMGVQPPAWRNDHVDRPSREAFLRECQRLAKVVSEPPTTSDGAPPDPS